VAQTADDAARSLSTSDGGHPPAGLSRIDNQNNFQRSRRFQFRQFFCDDMATSAQLIMLKHVVGPVPLCLQATLPGAVFDFLEPT
jgi:hypothetical protein